MMQTGSKPISGTAPGRVSEGCQSLDVLPKSEIYLFSEIFTKNAIDKVIFKQTRAFYYFLHTLSLITLIILE